MLPALVIFDCDGVLVDSEVLAATVLARELTALGLPTTFRECLDRYTGVSMRAVMERIEAETPLKLPEDFAGRVHAADAQAFALELRPVEGAIEMLAALDLPRCVASSGAVAKMRLTLGLTGLLPYVEPHLFSAEMVAKGKPAPDLFLLAAARMATPSQRCVVVEDSVAGVRAARAAGMRVLGFAGGGHCDVAYAEKLRVAGAAPVFRRLRELPALLELS